LAHFFVQKIEATFMGRENAAAIFANTEISKISSKSRWRHKILVKFGIHFGFKVPLARQCRTLS